MKDLKIRGVNLYNVDFACSYMYLHNWNNWKYRLLVLYIFVIILYEGVDRMSVRGREGEGEIRVGRRGRR